MVTREDRDSVFSALRRERASEKWRKHCSDVLPVFVAEMDYPLAPAVAQALHDAIAGSDTGYAWPRPLRDVFARYAKASFDWEVTPERVVVVNDVMGGVTETLRSLTRPNDGVVIMPPVYPPFFEIITTAERRVVEVALIDDGARWAIDWDGLEAAFDAAATALLLCHPHNPVGRVFTVEELRRIAELARRYGALVISDEIHAPLVYEGARHVPFVTISEPLDVDAVTLMSASKGWNIAGLKCAQMVAGSERVHETFRRLPRDVKDRIGHLGVIATMAAYENGGEWMRQTLAKLDENRRLVESLMAEQVPDIRYRVPDATFLAWLDCRALNLGDDPAQAFLERGKVALAHGVDFGAPGRGFARLTFATTTDILAEGIARMRTVAG
jgi:cystathionine beta-lyase